MHTRWLTLTRSLRSHGLKFSDVHAALKAKPLPIPVRHAIIAFVSAHTIQAADLCVFLLSAAQQARQRPRRPRHGSSGQRQQVGNENGSCWCVGQGFSRLGVEGFGQMMRGLGMKIDAFVITLSRAAAQRLGAMMGSDRSVRAGLSGL